MITPQQIFDASHGGLDIIKYYYPQADERHAFRIRDERTPSARLRLRGDVWKVTDFGDDSHARNAIDICMREEKVTFYQAVCLLAGRYGVEDFKIGDTNKPRFEKRKADAGEKDGDYQYEVKDFSDYELKVLGPEVTPEICREYGIQALAWYSLTKKDEKTGELITTVNYSTDTFPQYVRQCRYYDERGHTASFYKAFKPLAAEKQYRFIHLKSMGEKPKAYINGYWELREWLKTIKRDDENEGCDDSPSQDKDSESPRREIAPIEVVFVCGERDALCCRAYGCRPLWRNSETATDFTDRDYRDICTHIRQMARGKDVEGIIYNVPDLDETGIRRGIDFAMQFLDIRTVWLPDWLRNYRDSRGHARKDLRDYADLCKRADFYNLLKVAMPMRFWEKVPAHDGGQRDEINQEYVLHHLKCAGFGRLEAHGSSAETTIVRVENNLVRAVTDVEVKNYLYRFLQERIFDLKIRNLLHGSRRISSDLFARLPVLNLNFTDFEHNRQYMFFQNGVIEATPEAATFVKGAQAKTIGRHVWAEEVIAHDVTRLKPSFGISRGADEEAWHIKVSSTDSKFFCYLINTSRMFWRQELEERLETETSAYDAALLEAARNSYLADHRFDIAGPLLSEAERAEQELNLVNKIFATGYLLHRYKMKSRPWAVYAMDNKGSTDDSRHNGGSGKSFYFDTIKRFMRSVTLPGQNFDLTSNKHLFDRVDEHTDLVLFDDARIRFPLQLIYDLTTGNWNVNPKAQRSYEIPFELSPKVGITTNGAPSSKEPSTMRRLLFMLFSDYYHQKTIGSDYRETRSIHDDFGCDLFDSRYPEKDWNADINFLMDCLQFYLSTVDRDVVIQPNMARVLSRIDEQLMGDDFNDWACTYFSPDNEFDALHLDRCIARVDAYNDFIAATGADRKKNSPQRFKRAIESWCQKMGYTLNPASLKGRDGRIICKIDGRTAEMLYIQTKEKIEN